MMVEKVFLKNIFNKNFNKKVLISYIVHPFIINENEIYHSNVYEARAIAKVFDDLNFQVDIVNYNYSSNINFSDYSILFGFGEPMRKSFECIEKTSFLRIYYATGAHSSHYNFYTINRVLEVNQKYNCKILPARISSKNELIESSFSDYIILIGNSWTKSTYEKFTNSPIYNLNATALFNLNLKKIKKDFNKAKKEFLFFAGSGLISKGLDLCLEFFSKNNELTLHICCPYEKQFFDVFKEMLDQPNIFFHNFININTNIFTDLISRCCFTILPTCSEGQATSLLTCMSAGLIPITTKYSGLSIEKYFGILIEDLNYYSIEKAIDIAMKIPENILREISLNLKEIIKTYHSINYFYINFKKIIYTILINEGLINF